MAEKHDAGAAARPGLWLAHPAGVAGPVHRQPRLERVVRDALLLQASAPGRPAKAGAALSHSCGWVACGVGARTTTGVDLEWLGRRPVMRLARFSYSRDEATALAEMPPSERLARFHELWVLKEAAAKALGLPLFTALARCRFRLDARRIHAELPGGIAWRAWVYAPRDGLRLACLALDRRAPAPRCMEWPHGDTHACPRGWPLIASGRG